MKAETKAGLKNVATAPLEWGRYILEACSQFPRAVLSGSDEEFFDALKDDYYYFHPNGNDCRFLVQASNLIGGAGGLIGAMCGVAAGCSALGMGSAGAWIAGILVGAPIGLFAGPCLIGAAAAAVVMAFGYTPVGAIINYPKGCANERQRQATVARQQAVAAQVAPSQAQTAADNLQDAIRNLPEDQREDFARKIMGSLKDEFTKAITPEETAVEPEGQMFKIRLKKQK